MSAVNTDVFGAPYSELTIDTAQVTVTKRYHTIAAAGTATAGTITNVLIDSGVGTQLNGNLMEVFLRPKTGHLINFQHAVGATAPIYMLGSQSINLNDQQTLHLMRNPGSNSWLGVNGIKLPAGALVDLASVQTLSNKSLTAPILTTPEVVGSLVHQGIIAGYNGAENTIGQIGTTVVGVATGTVTSFALAAEKSMKITARVLAAKNDHTQSLFTEVTGLFRRDISGNIVMVGTTSPITIGTSALAISLSVDTTAQAANILATGIAGTSHFIVDYQYNQLGQA